MTKHICGTPDAQCTGTLLAVNKIGRKLHNTAPEAFECYRKHLISLGYKPRISKRELEGPDGTIQVLTKPIRFGAAVRLGKRGDDEGVRSTKRWTYRRGGKTAPHNGTIIGL